MDGMALKKVKNKLPLLMQELADVVGYEVVAKLIFHFGGLRVKLSKRSANWETLKNTLGEQGAEAIADYFADEEVYIPRCELAIKALRKMRIIEELQEQIASGKSKTASVKMISQKYGISDRHTWEILRKSPVS